MSDIDGERKIEYVLMDAFGRCTGMCCVQWQDDEFVDNAEDVRPNQGRRP